MIDIKIELEKLNIEDTKFKDKELIFNKMIQRVIVIAADWILDHYRNECSFELKYILRLY